MSVYTLVTLSQLRAFFDDYDLGRIDTFEGIADGIANSNYAVRTTQGDFILTLFESQSVEELSHYVMLLNHLAQSAALYPNPRADRQGHFLRSLNGKPALVCERLSGRAIDCPTREQCRQIGASLAGLHLETRDVDFPIAGTHAPSALATLFDRIKTDLSVEDTRLIEDELQFQARIDEPLPGGVIHGDLFRDNALFDNGRLSGIVDFYSACHDSWLRDIAVCANDWCHEDTLFDRHRFDALLDGYERIRPLSEPERRQCRNLLRGSALRFWLSRLVHRHSRRTASLTQPKDPFVFRHLLLQHRRFADV
ncbi:MAG: homoserine kinase [Methylomicrobium sp.]